MAQKLKYHFTDILDPDDRLDDPRFAVPLKFRARDRQPKFHAPRVRRERALARSHRAGIRIIQATK